jgi:hypothetical protein
VNAQRSLKRILSLRQLQEEQEEAALLHERQLREACLDALRHIDEEKTVASRSLHAALLGGQREDAISAELALACWPVRQHTLQIELAHREDRIEACAASWAAARLRHRQAETAAQWLNEAAHRRVALHVQKELDEWFVTRKAVLASRAEDDDESSPRLHGASPQFDGTQRAETDGG